MSRRLCLRLLIGILATSLLPARGIAAGESPKEWDEGVLGQAVALVLKRTAIELRNDGPAVQTNLKLVFKNPRGRVVEGVCYIPASAAMVERGFTVESNGIVMQGQVRSRDRVIRVYRNVTRSRQNRSKDPAVLERINEHLLRVTISPIPADANIVVSLSSIGLLESFGTGRKFEQAMPTRRGESAGGMPFRFEGELTTTGDVAVHGPGQRLEHFAKTEYGHEFSLAGPSSHDGFATLFFDEQTPRPPAQTRCFHSGDGDGFFVTEIDPAFLLARPLEAASYVVVLDLPGTTSGSTLKAAKAMLDRFLGRLQPADRICVLTSDARRSLGGRSKFAKEQVVQLARQAALKSAAGGKSDLSRLLPAAFQAVNQSGLPGRILLLSGASRVPDIEQTAGSLCRFLHQAPANSAMFTMALGRRADHESLDRLARWGRGRGFVAKSPDHLTAMAASFIDAARHPIWELPAVEIAGASEVVVDQVRALTFGDTLFASGRYHSGGPTLLRLRGLSGATEVDEIVATHFREDCQAAPWVATLWAKRRIDDLSAANAQHPAQDMQYFATRLSEQFGLLGPDTVSLALEPALLDRMPQFVGPAPASTGVMAMASPFEDLPDRIRIHNNPSPAGLVAEHRGERRSTLGSSGFSDNTTRTSVQHRIRSLQATRAPARDASQQPPAATRVATSPQTVNSPPARRPAPVRPTARTGARR